LYTKALKFMEKILITDGRSLATLAIARSLGEKNLEVHCGEEFRNNITFFSRYVKKRVIYPSPQRCPDEFVRKILDLVKAERYDMLMPVRDETSLLLSRHEDELTKYTNLYLANFETMRMFRDKGETVQLAMDKEVPCPKTYFPENTSIQKIKEDAPYPVLIRPRVSSGSRGIEYVRSRGEFDAAYHNVKRDYGEPIIQEHISKKGYCTACLLLDRDSREIASFTYERVKEYPVSGGPTVVGISCRNHAIKEYALKLLRGVGWTGVAEVEFIIDAKGEPKLLEVNPRFWMPLNLAISSGVDFPYLLYRLARGEEVEPVTSYKVGMKYRWVLPNEILWLMQAPDKLRGIKEFVNFWDDGTCYGELSFRDPLPVAGVILQALNYMASSERRGTIFKRGWTAKR
jgi:predicted ATP-grasp superfamily ATP-dependent carboligase